MSDNNLNILASSTITGGEYNKIKIFGSTDVNGDLKANKMDVFGSADFNSYCNIKNVNIYGSADFNSAVEIEELSIKGSCDFNNEAAVKKLNVYGSVEFKDKAFKFEEVNIYGVLTARVLEADKILIKGVLDCSEQLNADLIEFTSNGECTIKEMVGSRIIVKPKHQFISFKKESEWINVDLIEGDDIDIENVKAKVVRGNNVKIGRNCEIELVEYHTELKVDDKSKVKQTNKF